MRGKCVSALSSWPNATAAGRLNDLVYFPTSSGPGAMQERQCARKSVDVLTSPPNGAETGSVRHRLSSNLKHQVVARKWLMTFKPSRCVACASMYPRLSPIRWESGGKRSRQRSICAVVNATMPRKGINATASSPNAAATGQLNDFFDTASRKTRHLKPSRQVAMRKVGPPPLKVDRRNGPTLDVDYPDDRTHIKIKTRRRPMTPARGTQERPTAVNLKAIHCSLHDLQATPLLPAGPPPTKWRRQKVRGREVAQASGGQTLAVKPTKSTAKPTKSTAKPKTASHFAPSTPGESHSPSDESNKPRIPSKREHRRISMAGFDADTIDDGTTVPMMDYDARNFLCFSLYTMVATVRTRTLEYPMLNVTRRPYHLERRDLYNPLAALDVADMQGLIMQIGVDFALYGTPIPMFAWVSLHIESYGRQECKARSLSQLLLSSLQLPYELGTSVQDVMGLLVRLDIMGTVANNFNYLVSDAVVVWRAYILWSDSLVAKGILLSFLTGTLAIQSDVKLAFLLATNVVATVLIGIKFWYYRRDIKGALGLFTRKSQVEKVLVLLLESGITYCAIWIAYTIIWTDAEGLNISYYTSDTFGSAIHNIAGIYPTFVVLVAMQSNAAQELLGTQVSQAMRFADLPMMSVASESESQEANDPTVELYVYRRQQTRGSGSIDYGSLGDARKSNEEGNGIAITSDSQCRGALAVRIAERFLVVLADSGPMKDILPLARKHMLKVVESCAYESNNGDLCPSTNGGVLLLCSKVELTAEADAKLPLTRSQLDRYRLSSTIMMSSLNLTPAEVMGLVPGPVPVPAEMTDEHRKILLASQLRVIATLSPAAQGVLHCRFSAEYLPRAVEKWRNSEDVLCPPVMLLSEIDWCPYVLRFLLLKDNQDLVVMQLNRTLHAADAIDGMEMEDLERVMHVLCTLLLVQGRLGISEADAEAFTPRLRAWERRYPHDLNRNTAERCFVLLTKPFATRIYYIPDLRAEKMKGVETCANSKCYQSVTVDEKPLLRCKKCKSAMYCCREHQKAHWPAHKSRCFEVNY
ncbi:hypothetical protein EV715DRAFT_263077 [Schizophyllum commune]